MHPKFDRDPTAKAECARQLRLTVAGRAAREAVRGKARRLHIFCNSARETPFGISSDIGSRARSRIPGEDDLELGATLERIGPGTASIVQTVFDLSDR